MPLSFKDHRKNEMAGIRFPEVLAESEPLISQTTLTPGDLSAKEEQMDEVSLNTEKQQTPQQSKEELQNSPVYMTPSEVSFPLIFLTCD